MAQRRPELGGVCYTAPCRAPQEPRAKRSRREASRYSLPRAAVMPPSKKSRFIWNEPSLLSSHDPAVPSQQQSGATSIAIAPMPMSMQRGLSESPLPLRPVANPLASPATSYTRVPALQHATGSDEAIQTEIQAASAAPPEYRAESSDASKPSFRSGIHPFVMNLLIKNGMAVRNTSERMIRQDLDRHQAMKASRSLVNVSFIQQVLRPDLITELPATAELQTKATLHSKAEFARQVQLSQELGLMLRRKRANSTTGGE